MANRSDLKNLTNSRATGIRNTLKPVIWFLALSALLLLPVESLGQATKPAGTSVNSYEYFRLGEICESLARYEYYVSVGEGLKQRLSEHRKHLQKLNLSQASIAAFDNLSSIALAMPFANETNFSKWSTQDRERWNSEGVDARVNLGEQLKADITKVSQSELFYWMGYQSLRLSWSIPIDVDDHGLKSSIVKGKVKSALQDFMWVKDHKLSQNLTPEVMAWVNAIASMKSKADDPLEGITKNDINKMAEIAQAIRDAAKEKKLFR